MNMHIFMNIFGNRSICDWWSTTYSVYNCYTAFVSCSYHWKKHKLYLHVGNCLPDYYQQLACCQLSRLLYIRHRFILCKFCITSAETDKNVAKYQACSQWWSCLWWEYDIHWSLQSHACTPAHVHSSGSDICSKNITIKITTNQMQTMKSMENKLSHSLNH